jgi:hypothetical protein
MDVSSFPQVQVEWNPVVVNPVVIPVIEATAPEYSEKHLMS